MDNSAGGVNPVPPSDVLLMFTQMNLAAEGRETILRKEATERETSLRKEATEREDQLRREFAEREAQLRREFAEREAQLRSEFAEHEALLRKEFAEKDSRLIAVIKTTLAPKESPSAISYANAGSEALGVLAISKGIADAGPPPEGSTGEEMEPIVSSADLLKLRACSSESELVALITPFLRAARGIPHDDRGGDPCARLLINSERIAWLDSLDAPLLADQRKRPDLFSTWAPFWSGHQSATGPVGKLAARALQLDGCVREFYEGKVGEGEFTPADFGQLVDFHSRVRGTVRGVLFNARHFWLFHSFRHQPVSLTKGLLDAPGSRSLFRRFFEAGDEPPLLLLLRHLFKELNVVPRMTAVGASVKDSSVFLGAGGSSRVFSVLASNGKLCALKASTQLSLGELRYEFDIMQRAAAAGAPVVPTVPDSLTLLVDVNTGSFCGGGFLLQGVCRRVTLGSSTRLAAKAFAVLRELHAAGFAHGDARLPNLLHSESDGGRLLWIDMREGADGSGSGEEGLQAAKRADVRTLAASMLGIEQGGELPGAVLAALPGVPTDPDAYARVADALYT